MPKFDSPLGSQKFAGPSMREVDVPDDSNYQAAQPPVRGKNIPFDENAMREFQARMQPVLQAHDVRDMSEEEELELRAARNARKQGKERLTDGAKRRIEMLVQMTRLQRTVEIDGNSYILQTLKSKELRDAFTAAAEFDGTVQFSFETAKQILGRSLIHIAGMDIEDFISSTKLEDKLLFVEDMDQALFTRLYAEYNVLNKEAQDKYSIKTVEEVKELVEDLKK